MARPKDLNLERAWRQRLQRHSTSGKTISNTSSGPLSVRPLRLDQGVIGGPGPTSAVLWQGRLALDRPAGRHHCSVIDPQ